MSHLLIHRGPNQGHRVPLDSVRTVLGRDSVCDVVLYSTDAESKKHLVISRKHAIITRVEDRHFIEDGDGDGKESRNHTYVNGELVPFPTRRELKNDDVIRICDFLLIFHDGDPSDSPSSVDAAISHDSSSVFLAQPAEKLKVLLEITNRLTNTLELEQLLPRVVEDLMEIFRQADRAFLILLDEVTGEPIPRFRKIRGTDRDGQSGFSTSIVSQCLKTVQGLLLSNDVSSAKDALGQQLVGSSSIASLGLRSVMCAPLWSKESQEDRAFGVLLLDSQHDKRKFTEEDLNLLMAVANQSSIALANLRYHRDALMRERLNRDLALAREVAKSFLPADLPQVPDYEFFACNESAREVGGDYYDFLPLSGNRLGILVGDVAGKGVAAALVMARFSAEARACLRTVPDLAAAVCQLNTLMQPINLTDRFVTLAALMLDLTTHTVTVVNAGHPSPLLRRANGAIEEIAAKADSGPPIGVLDGYPYVACQVVLQPGDVVVLFSDGVTDALDVQRRFLGMQGLYALLDNLPPSSLGTRIVQAVKAHAAGCDQYDDVTVVCFGRTAAN